jgi:hypothetical protein
MVVMNMANNRMSPTAADYALEKSVLPGYSALAIMPTLTPIPDPNFSAYEMARQREQQRIMNIQMAQQSIATAQRSMPPVGMFPERDFSGMSTPPAAFTQTGMPALAGVEDRVQGPAMPGQTSAPPVKPSMSVPTADFLQKETVGVEDAEWGSPMQYPVTADQLVSQYTSDPAIRGMIGSLQRQAYGDIIETFGGAPIYDNTQQKYWGISADMQAAGYLAPMGMPNMVPGPDATEEEKLAYQEKVRQSYQAPRYRIGSEIQILGNMDKNSIFKLQKRMAAARLLPENYAIIPGVLQPEEYSTFTAILGRANISGYEFEDVLTMRIAQVKELKEREKQRRAAGGGGGPTTRQVNIQYTQTSLAQGRSLLAGVLRDALGRPPSESELAEFMARLNAAENKSPVRTVTNYVRSGGTTTATSRTRPSGVDPDQMAREFASEISGGDEMAGYQVNRFMEMLVARLMGAQNA